MPDLGPVPSSGGGGAAVGYNLSPPTAVGNWLAQAATGLGTFNFTVGDLRLGALYLPGWTLDGLAWEVTIAAGSGGTSRAVLYADDGTGKPGNLVLDSGAVNSEVAAVKQVTSLSSGLLAAANGVYWGGVVNQGGGAAATLRYVTTAPLQFIRSSPSLSGLGASFWFLSGVTGTPPSTGAAATANDGGYPRIAVRRAS